MSKSKRNQVQFTRPDDPKFLKLIKQQIGYQDGPGIDAKRPKVSDNDFEENDDSASDVDEEKPQVVVVKSGDLTAEEAERERIRIETEYNTKPADLSERIIFKAKSSKIVVSTAATSEESSASSRSNISKSSESKSKLKAVRTNKSTLSFNDEEDEDNDE